MVNNVKEKLNIDSKPLIILTGPTAVGKTDLSIKLAKALDGEIISADSAQVYKGLDIGSAKVTEEEMQGVPHHLIDVYEPDFSFDVTVFKEEAKKAVEEIYSRGRIPIIVGGTGFYIQALLYDISFDENILDCRIQKLTLQPIVENALYHGVKNKRGSGHIKVMGRAEGRDLIFTVEDDGIGMKEDELENLRSLISGDTKPPEEGGFGMANVEQRLEMHYGREYGMRVESEYMKGTTVTVKIPQINGASCAVRLQDR